MIASPWIPPASPFGAGRSERCIEVPWGQAWLQGRRRVLDIGFALSDLDWLRVLLGHRAGGAALQAVDIITPERVASRYPDDLRAAALATPVTVGDVRRVELPAAAFDAVTCISTIEHVGFDVRGADETSAFARWSTLEATPAGRDPQTGPQVMAALAQALAPGGLLLISVPMGRGGAVPVRDSLGFYTRQQEYDAASWREVVETPGLQLLEQRFFTHAGEAGWREASDPAELAHQTAWLTPHAVGVALAVLERAA
jgi:SAM-dependent methyltransferase